LQFSIFTLQYPFMTNRSAQFVRMAFTNADRSPEEQQAILQKAQAIMERLEKIPLRVSAFEPLVLRLFYLFNEAFMTPRKSRPEFLGLCFEAFRAGRALRYNAGNPDKWAKAALHDLLRRGLLRQAVKGGQRYILSTDLGDEFIDNPSAKLPPFKRGGPLTTKAKRPDSAPEEEKPTVKKSGRPSIKSGREMNWFATAVNLLRDGHSDAEIARRVGISKSTLSVNKRWKQAKKAYALQAEHDSHFEKRRGVRRHILRLTDS
jgi:hypothetical protein